MSKLYIGNLAWAVTDAMLQDLFSQAGTVTSAQVVTDRATGRSRGFGFVEMASDEDAQNAITMFDGKDLEGRSLKVSEARPLSDRPKRTGGFRPRGGFEER
jgi:RNA recognition motif-containing protein